MALNEKLVFEECLTAVDRFWLLGNKQKAAHNAAKRVCEGVFSGNLPSSDSNYLIVGLRKLTGLVVQASMCID